MSHFFFTNLWDDQGYVLCTTTFLQKVYRGMWSSTHHSSHIRPRWSRVAKEILTTKYTRSNTAWKVLTTSIHSLLKGNLGYKGVYMGDTILLRPLSSIALVPEPSILSHHYASVRPAGRARDLVLRGCCRSALWPMAFPQLNVADERALGLANHFHPQYTLHSVLWGIIAHS